MEEVLVSAKLDLHISPPPSAVAGVKRVGWKDPDIYLPFFATTLPSAVFPRSRRRPSESPFKCDPMAGLERAYCDGLGKVWLTPRLYSWAWLISWEMPMPTCCFVLIGEFPPCASPPPWRPNSCNCGEFYANDGFPCARGS